MNLVEARDLCMSFPCDSGCLDVLEEVNFSIAPQEFISLLGPSGSGKSTILRLVAGLLPPTGGEIRFTVPEGGRSPRLGLVFQQANLMPWRTALQNILLPLELQGVDSRTARARAQEMIELTGLQGFENAWPHDLSGGMAQRVALARALIHDPDLLLLDEPFGALDALTREQMQDELLHIWGARKKTVLMVTHSISEALLLSDRVLVLSPRPARICEEMVVNLPRPRPNDLRYTPAFGEMARRLRAAIAEQ